MDFTRTLHAPEATEASTDSLTELMIRPLKVNDAGLLAAAYERNRGHLAPWEPRRSDVFFTREGQEQVVQGKLQQQELGSEMPWVITDGPNIVGAMTLSGIVHGPFRSANLGYWIDHGLTGRGLATKAVQEVLEMARNGLGLHRVQAATLVHNDASQAVLKRSGFERIGVAPSYLNIAGRWQDHVLFQRILF
ncbi:GNAT family protein [Paenarthrobacter ilicis]|uniref:GNAT family N-acetyltransferase n=1 Tax=Paenarthrobacter ilicis TaxID=43665 RepID=UPI003008F732